MSIVTFEGVDYILRQDAYVGNEVYTATAYKLSDINNIPEDELQLYSIEWDIVNDDCEDESEACDWENPSSVEEL